MPVKFQASSLRSESRISPAVTLEASVRPASLDAEAAVTSSGAIINALAKATLTAIADCGGRLRPSLPMAATPSGDVFVKLAGIVDFDAERQRLRKEIERSRKEIAFLEGKLGRPEFVERAPAGVVERDGERLAELRQTVQKLSTSLAALG